MNRWVAVAAVALAVGAACSAPTPEDHRRVAILTREAILEFDAEGIEPVGPVNTVVGHGDGPAVVDNEASRRFTSALPPPDIMDAIIPVVESEGWQIVHLSVEDTRASIYGSKTVDGVRVSLDIIVLPIDDHFRNTRVIPADHDYRIGMQLRSNRAGTD
jgi:hypothetical protein